MKTQADLENRLRLELTHSFTKMCRDPCLKLYLYYMESTPEHEGGFVFCATPPPTSEYKLAVNKHISSGYSIDQNMNEWREIVFGLPVLRRKSDE